MPGKRKKDPEFYRLRELLEQFLDAAEGYRVHLEAECAAQQSKPSPNMHLVRAVQRQLDVIRKLETLLDEDGWSALIELANVSAYIEHARTGGYF